MGSTAEESITCCSWQATRQCQGNCPHACLGWKTQTLACNVEVWFSQIPSPTSCTQCLWDFTATHRWLVNCVKNDGKRLFHPMILFQNDVMDMQDWATLLAWQVMNLKTTSACSGFSFHQWNPITSPTWLWRKKRSVQYLVCNILYLWLRKFHKVRPQDHWTPLNSLLSISGTWRPRREGCRFLQSLIHLRADHCESRWGWVLKHVKNKQHNRPGQDLLWVEYGTMALGSAWKWGREKGLHPGLLLMLNIVHVVSPIAVVSASFHL